MGAPPRMRLRVRIDGRVQGVWFRGATRERATELGLDGWVRNLPDGSVEALFEGPHAAVEQALEFVRKGPPLARVTRVQVEQEALGEEVGAAAGGFCVIH